MYVLVNVLNLVPITYHINLHFQMWMESSADSAGPHLAANESDIDSSIQDSNYATLEIDRQT